MKTVPAWARSGLGSSKSINNNKKIPFFITHFIGFPLKRYGSPNIHARYYALLTLPNVGHLAGACQFGGVLFACCCAATSSKRSKPFVACKTKRKTNLAHELAVNIDDWKKRDRKSVNDSLIPFLRALHAHLQREFDCSDGLQAGREAIDSERNLDHSKTISLICISFSIDFLAFCF